MTPPVVFKAFAESVVQKANENQPTEVEGKLLPLPYTTSIPNPRSSRSDQNREMPAKVAIDKIALVERLARLAATDVEALPGIKNIVSSTPRLLMKHRNPEELGALEKGVTRAFRKVEAPLERKLNTATAGWSPGVKNLARKGGRLLIRNPEQIPLQAIPVPGVSPLMFGAKRGLERAIDRLAPAQTVV